MQTTAMATARMDEAVLESAALGDPSATLTQETPTLAASRSTARLPHVGAILAAAASTVAAAFMTHHTQQARVATLADAPEDMADADGPAL